MRRSRFSVFVFLVALAMGAAGSAQGAGALSCGAESGAGRCDRPQGEPVSIGVPIASRNCRAARGPGPGRVFAPAERERRFSAHEQSAPGVFHQTNQERFGGRLRHRSAQPAERGKRFRNQLHSHLAALLLGGNTWHGWQQAKLGRDAAGQALERMRQQYHRPHHGRLRRSAAGPGESGRRRGRHGRIPLASRRGRGPRPQRACGQERSAPGPGAAGGSPAAETPGGKPGRGRPIRPERSHGSPRPGAVLNSPAAWRPPERRKVTSELARPPTARGQRIELEESRFGGHGPGGDRKLRPGSSAQPGSYRQLPDPYRSSDGWPTTTAWAWWSASTSLRWGVLRPSG